MSFVILMAILTLAVFAAGAHAIAESMSMVEGAIFGLFLGVIYQCTFFPNGTAQAITGSVVGCLWGFFSPHIVEIIGDIIKSYPERKRVT
jgi:uncharacterized membrane protein